MHGEEWMATPVHKRLVTRVMECLATPVSS